jgi:RNA polymerase sigma-70 factor (ECF subfamily)
MTAAAPSPQQIAQLYRPELMSFALRLTQDDDRARDLLQQTGYLVVKHFGSYQTGTNFVAWIKTILRNTFLSDYRKTRRRRELRDAREPAQGWMTVATGENTAIQQLTVEEINRVIDDLPPIYRDTFRYFLAQLSYREIALRTGVPIGTAKGRVFTARRLLRERLARLY